MTDGGCGARNKSSSSTNIENNMFLYVLGGNHRMSQCFGADLILFCMITDNDALNMVTKDTICWESTRGQGKVHVQREIFSTSTQRYVLLTYDLPQ